VKKSKEKNNILVKKFSWDGKKVQRIRNSSSDLRGRRPKDFILLWAMK